MKKVFTLAEGATHIGMSDNIRRYAFTLAEVLITLAIIGIVAAVTIPTLINNYQKKLWTSQFLENVSTLSQGMKVLIVNAGCTDSGLICTGLFPTGNVDDKYYENLDNAMKKVFKVTKTCMNDDTSCAYDVQGLNYTFTDKKSKLGLNIWNYNNINTSGRFLYELANGAIISIVNKGCTSTSYPEISKSLKIRCADIVFDVNGKNPPNTFGRDIFGVIVSADGNIYPYGGIDFAKFLQGENWENSKNYWKSSSANYKNNCDTSISSQGYACGARIMENNGVMDY